MTEKIELEMRVTGLTEDESGKDENPKETVTYYRTDLEGPEMARVLWGGKSSLSLINQLADARLGQRFKVTIEPVEEVPAAQIAEDEGVFQ